MLQVQKRIEHLAECERGTREYRKQNEVYWGIGIGIKESRSQRHRVCTEAAEVGHIDFNNINKLTTEEIKLRLQEMGVRTRRKCKAKLRELLIIALDDKENAIPKDN